MFFSLIGIFTNQISCFAKTLFRLIISVSDRRIIFLDILVLVIAVCVCAVKALSDNC